MFVALIWLMTVGIPAAALIATGVLLVRRRMSESIATVGGVLGVLAMTFGTILAVVALYVFVMVLLGEVVTVVTTEESG